MKAFQFPSPSPPHIAYIKDRPRNSGLTSLRFVGDDKFVCCDFNEKKMYLVQFADAKLRIIATTPTIIQNGTPVQTDLLDINNEGLLVVSNFYQGSQSLFQLHGDRISFVCELKLNNYQRCHGVRFVPGYDDLLWVDYCGDMNKCVVVLDYKKKKALHTLTMTEQMQDTAFIGNYAIAPARTNHITIGAPYPGRMYATVYLFVMPENLYLHPPRLIDTWHGPGHMDAMKEFGDYAYTANQYTDRVDVFGIGANERIEQQPSINGFWMPHGVDIRHDGLLGVTNYGDNSVRLMNLETTSPAQRATETAAQATNAS